MSINKAIGILGGTFDPVHHGHLRLALETQTQLKLDHVRLIPLKSPAHRQAPTASEQQRLSMLQLAVNDQESLMIDDRELKRDGVSYSIDTLKLLREEFPEKSLCLITGKDAFQYLDTWKEWQQLLDYAHIIVAERPDEEEIIYNETIQSLLKKHETNNIDDLSKQINGHIMQIDIPLLDISSTKIRASFASKNIPYYLLPENVINYIQKEKLYA